MDLKPKGRRALGTGSSSGVGEAIVRMLTEEGAQVAVHGHNRERAEQIASSINAARVAIADFISNYKANTLGVVQLCQLCVPV